MHAVKIRPGDSKAKKTSSNSRFIRSINPPKKMIELVEDYIYFFKDWFR